MSAVIINARVLAMCDDRAGDGVRVAAAPKTGPQLGHLNIRPCAAVFISKGRIEAVSDGPGTPEGLMQRFQPSRIIDAAGRVLMPGFVDAHTHACWAGDRLDEWDLRRRGASYLDILKAGGGIMSTVRATRAADDAALVRLLRERLSLMLRRGTTTVEVKSGYGLSIEHELRMLRSIRTAAEGFAGTVVPTALLGHAFDPEMTGGTGQAGEDAAVDELIAEGLPTLSREFPGITLDAYCEQGAWSVAQCERLFAAGLSARPRHPFRVHADQFNRLGMVQRAVEMGATSVDHLEASGADELAALARAPGTFGVVLPMCGLHLDNRFANARALVDAAPTSKVAIATNFNPGSAPSPSMPLAISLAVRKCGLTPHEAIAAATVNPACLLGLHDRGVIAPGARADLLLLRYDDERHLAFELDAEPIDLVMCNGQIMDGAAHRDGGR